MPRTSVIAVCRGGAGAESAGVGHGPGQRSDLGFCAPPGTRTPNPLIIGLICSTLPYAARNPFTSRVLVALWCHQHFECRRLSSLALGLSSAYGLRRGRSASL